MMSRLQSRRLENSKNQIPNTKEIRMNQTPKGWRRAEQFWGLGFGASLEFRVWSLEFRAALVLALFVGAVATARAAEPTKAQIEFFENTVRPIFADNCYKCHSPAKGKIKGGLE